MSSGIDASQLRELAVDLEAAGSRARDAVRPRIAKGAHNIKEQINADFAASRHFKGAATSASYDLLDGGFTAEIGPDKQRRGGAIGNVAIFGTSRGGGTVPDPILAMQAEEARLLAEISEAVARSLQ